MVNVVRRMTKLTGLLQLRVGPGAMILPPEVTRIHMEFARSRDEGHKGPRVFWRTDLRRLKYYNPSVPMTVSRSLNPADPATMEIHFSKPDTASTPTPSNDTPTSASTPTTDSSSALATGKTERINIKNDGRGLILERLISITNPKMVEPTPEELSQLEELKEKKERGRKDSLLMQKVNKRRKEEKEKELLLRGGIDLSQN